MPEQYFTGFDKTKTETTWTVNSIISGFSFRSKGSLSKVFSVMFPYSSTASAFSLRRAKAQNVARHGLALYFKQLLFNDIKKSDILTVSFDEKLNQAIQTSERNTFVRYWDCTENEVKVRYIGSSFVDHETHKDLTEHITNFIEVWIWKIWYLIWMDGPNFSVKFYVVFIAKNKYNFIISLWILALATSASYMTLLYARLFSFEFYSHLFPNCSLNWSVSCLVLSSLCDPTTSKTKKISNLRKQKYQFHRFKSWLHTNMNLISRCFYIF